MCQNVPELGLDLGRLPLGSKVCTFICCVSCVMDLFKPSLGIKVIFYYLNIRDNATVDILKLNLCVLTELFFL